MMMRIKKVDYVEEYKLMLLFNNNKIKIIDLKGIVKKGKGMFLPLKNIEYFKQVAVDNDGITICWPNGADLSPDVLYEIGKDIEEQKKLTKTPSRLKRKNPTKIKYQSTAIAKRVSKSTRRKKKAKA